MQFIANIERVLHPGRRESAINVYVHIPDTLVPSVFAGPADRLHKRVHRAGSQSRRVATCDGSSDERTVMEDRANEFAVTGPHAIEESYDDLMDLVLHLLRFRVNGEVGQNKRHYQDPPLVCCGEFQEGASGRPVWG